MPYLGGTHSGLYVVVPPCVEVKRVPFICHQLSGPASEEVELTITSSTHLYIIHLIGLRRDFHVVDLHDIVSQLVFPCDSYLSAFSERFFHLLNLRQ